MEQRSRVTGDVINFEGLTHAPVNEQEVVFLFAKIHQNLGIRIDKIQTAFPDVIGSIKKMGRRGGGKKRKLKLKLEVLILKDMDIQKMNAILLFAGSMTGKTVLSKLSN